MNKHTVFVAGKRFILLSDDKEEYVKKLLQTVEQASGQEGLTAVLCAGSRSMEKTAAILNEHFTAAAGRQIPVLRAGDSLPEKGVFLLTLAHAKGLEFDGVILPDAGADTYPDTPLSRHRLYTALSRATRRLAVLARGEMTPLLHLQ